MPRVISILSTIVAFGAVLAYALWPGARPHPVETTQCAASDNEAALQARVQELEATRHRLESQIASLHELASAAQDEAAQGKPSPPTAAAVTRPRFAPIVLTHEQRMLAVRQRNGQLFREAGLSPEQIQALVPVLATQEERIMSAAQSAHGLVGRGAEGNAVDPQNHDELVRAIGEEKAAQFEGLRKTLGSRMELQRLRDELEQAGEPISEEQRQRLLARMSTRPQLSAADRNGSSPEDRFREIERQRSEQLRGEVSTVLSPAQLELFDQGQELHKAYSSHISSASFGASAAAGSAAPAH